MTFASFASIFWFITLFSQNVKFTTKRPIPQVKSLLGSVGEIVVWCSSSKFQTSVSINLVLMHYHYWFWFVYNQKGTMNHSLWWNNYNSSINLIITFTYDLLDSHPPMISMYLPTAIEAWCDRPCKSDPSKCHWFSRNSATMLRV